MLIIRHHTFSHKSGCKGTVFSPNYQRLFKKTDIFVLFLAHYIFFHYLCSENFQWNFKIIVELR